MVLELQVEGRTKFLKCKFTFVTRSVIGHFYLLWKLVANIKWRKNGSKKYCFGGQIVHSLRGRGGKFEREAWSREMPQER